MGMRAAAGVAAPREVEADVWGGLLAHAAGGTAAVATATAEQRAVAAAAWEASTVAVEGVWGDLPARVEGGWAVGGTAAQLGEASVTVEGVVRVGTDSVGAATGTAAMVEAGEAAAVVVAQPGRAPH